ncbi:hypothetical protein GIX45_10435 [Erwinia sp. CPCC 100877]|nr:hypothetical protein [Erwinia sp. CPCC 100877]
MNDKAIEAIKLFTQIMEAADNFKQMTSKIIQNFFILLFDVISQFLFFLLCLLPFVGGIVLLCVLIWKTVHYFLHLFSTWDDLLVNDTSLKEQVHQQVIQAAQVDYEKERVQWKNNAEQLVNARDYYQKEYERLLSQLKGVKAQLSEQVNVPAEPVKETVFVPDKTLSLALYKSDMKKQLRSVLTSVEEVQAETIYQEAIEAFAYELFVMQIRYALPYKIIMRLFEIYSEETLKDFYQSFSILMEALKLRKYKKIYRNSYYSSEQKIQLFAQFGLLDKLDKEFSNFLFYLLNKYNYQQVRELHQHFQKVWSIRYYQGVVKVILPSETEISVFRRLWDNSLSNCAVEFVIHAEIKKGVIIQSAQTSVDLSYQQLIDQCIDHYEMEVSL